MRPDQYEKLKLLSEKLIDVFLMEANPEHWPGAGIAPNAMDKATRGDRVWVKKDAAGTAVLTMKIMSMTGMVERGGYLGGLNETPPQAEDEDDSLDAAIASAEKEAAAVLERVQQKMGG